jgi:hypothetical protein
MGLYKKISRYVHVPIFSAWLIVAAVASGPLSKEIGFGYWTTFMALSIVGPIMGWIITSGDDW